MHRTLAIHYAYTNCDDSSIGDSTPAYCRAPSSWEMRYSRLRHRELNIALSCACCCSISWRDWTRAIPISRNIARSAGVKSWRRCRREMFECHAESEADGDGRVA